MDSMLAYAMGEANRGREQMVFDWDKAAEIIRDEKPEWAVAGLQGDMEWTSGPIYADEEGMITDSYTYLASTWATPVIEIKVGKDICQIPCYRMQHEVPYWNSKTMWPNSSIDILKKGKEPNEAVR